MVSFYCTRYARVLGLRPAIPLGVAAQPTSGVYTPSVWVLRLRAVLFLPHYVRVLSYGEVFGLTPEGAGAPVQRAEGDRMRRRRVGALDVVRYCSRSELPRGARGRLWRPKPATPTASATPKLAELRSARFARYAGEAQGAMTCRRPSDDPLCCCSFVAVLQIAAEKVER